VGFDGDLSAERAQHKQIKFRLATVRFWARVQRSSDEGCWTWSGSVDDDGFGFVHMRQWGVRSRMYAHRFAYMISIGEIPTHQVVSQTCGTRRCVPPDHLQTRRRVSGKCPLERRARGDASGSRRHSESRHRGETSPSARLTSADVLSIRQRHVAGGVTYHELLKEFGVHEGTIGRIVRGETWRHLPGFPDRTKTVRRRSPLLPYPSVLNLAAKSVLNSAQLTRVAACW
jgi:hypothetical protein